ncbi:WD repeat-containing protein 5 [Zancudomyces culisetae]|uniref:WD repeat-containing protein 5 n=1 Tax=Zancudomyces culisetae TaxID=1213189 RepID=A0A1R1PFA9_ZANCU|nr:WD repeat-containing protein 5 [Zancudomyces culisetae]OMH80360.1 WD repeat-containing protein 5 [Zancudomyces culisetae]|eukprot:OMH79636.1 WD repeat-containing protein 5 [Zancudomyces culisetae]
MEDSLERFDSRADLDQEEIEKLRREIGSLKSRLDELERENRLLKLRNYEMTMRYSRSSSNRENAMSVSLYDRNMRNEKYTAKNINGDGKDDSSNINNGSINNGTSTNDNEHNSGSSSNRRNSNSHTMVGNLNDSSAVNRSLVPNEEGNTVQTNQQLKKDQRFGSSENTTKLEQISSNFSEEANTDTRLSEVANQNERKKAPEKGVRKHSGRERASEVMGVNDTVKLEEDMGREKGSVGRESNSVSNNGNGSANVSIEKGSEKRGKQFVTAGELTGHTGAIYTVEYTGSQQEEWIASGSFDRTVRIWDVNDLKQLECMEGHKQAVSVVRWKHDSSEVVASGGFDRQIFEWDVSKAQPMVTMRAETLVQSLAYMDGGLVCGQSNGSIDLFDGRAGTTSVMELGRCSGGGVTALQRLGNAHQMLSSDLGGHVSLLDLRKPAGRSGVMSTLVSVGCAISHLAFIQQENTAYISVNCYDNVLRIYDRLTDYYSYSSLGQSVPKPRLLEQIRGVQTSNWPIKSAFFSNIAVQSIARNVMVSHDVDRYDDRASKTIEKDLSSSLLLLSGSAEPVAYVYRIRTLGAKGITAEDGGENKGVSGNTQSSHSPSSDSSTPTSTQTNQSAKPSAFSNINGDGSGSDAISGNLNSGINVNNSSGGAYSQTTNSRYYYLTDSQSSNTVMSQRLGEGHSDRVYAVSTHCYKVQGCTAGADGNIVLWQPSAYSNMLFLPDY